MRLAITVEYDGTDYHGFQFQLNAATIQEELEKSIAGFTGETVRLMGGGRTDAGVHARGQMAAFDTASSHPPSKFLAALNFYLPSAIAVRAACRVGDDFDPRRMALSRRYTYTIVNAESRAPLVRRTAYLVAATLNVGRMREAARLFVGRRDFSRFAGPLENGRGGTFREVFDARVRRSGELLTFEVTGGSFLPHQVRRMAGALVDVGRGSMTPEQIKDMLDGRPGDTVAHALPPHGLCLESVEYADFPPKDHE